MKKITVAALVFAVSFFAGYAGAQSREFAAKLAQESLLSSTERLEKRETLDPSRFTEYPYVEAAYRAAKEIPGVLDKIFCYCYCSLNPDFKHKSLLTCYVDLHGAKCGICIKEAVIAKQMTAEGKTPTQIAKTFADFYLGPQRQQ